MRKGARGLAQSKAPESRSAFRREPDAAIAKFESDGELIAGDRFGVSDVVEIGRSWINYLAPSRPLPDPILA
jgi:hypothetical protein